MLGSSFIRASFCVLPRVSTIAMHQLPVSSLPLEVHVEPHKKQLHVTLAYHFQASHLPTLEKLAQNIDVKLGCDWVATIFSRDIRFANHEVTSHGGSCPCRGAGHCQYQLHLLLRGDRHARKAVGPALDQESAGLGFRPSTGWLSGNLFISRLWVPRG